MDAKDADLKFTKIPLGHGADSETKERVMTNKEVIMIKMMIAWTRLDLVLNVDQKGLLREEKKVTKILCI